MDQQTKHKVTTDVRHPYYDMCDQLSLLRDAVMRDPVAKLDDMLVGRLDGIVVEIDSLTAHLNKKYIWD